MPRALLPSGIEIEYETYGDPTDPALLLGTGYTPQLFLGATDVSAVLTVDGGARINPGDRAELAFELQRPIACEAGMRFALREGGKTIGAGVVVSVEAS